MPAEEGEVVPAESEEDEDIQVPELHEDVEFSHNNTYIDEKINDIVLTYDDSEDEGGSCDLSHSENERFDRPGVGEGSYHQEGTPTWCTYLSEECISW